MAQGEELPSCPLVPFAKPAKVLQTWDRHVFPILFLSRGAVVLGEFARGLKKAIERAK